MAPACARQIASRWVRDAVARAAPGSRLRCIRRAPRRPAGRRTASGSAGMRAARQLRLMHDLDQRATAAGTKSSMVRFVVGRFVPEAPLLRLPEGATQPRAAPGRVRPWSAIWRWFPNGAAMRSMVHDSPAPSPPAVRPQPASRAFNRAGTPLRHQATPVIRQHAPLVKPIESHRAHPRAVERQAARVGNVGLRWRAAAGHWRHGWPRPVSASDPAARLGAVMPATASTMSSGSPQRLSRWAPTSAWVTPGLSFRRTECCPERADAMDGTMRDDQASTSCSNAGRGYPPARSGVRDERRFALPRGMRLDLVDDPRGPGRTSTQPTRGPAGSGPHPAS